ncbi:hypothetical protein NLI96_g7684 [Meripilus lineatus]|uniref:Multidrug resistance-associated ABC transporter n=1 Tax=Meripilus lineatus TaxID=2056292 RepID=A0AAD5V0W7_9APHY|nr:hypothetical protein NLI96_g7684 [Physisporinus lineatus]
MFNLLHPPPAPPAFGEGRILPEGNASPLQKEDLWALPTKQLTENLTNDVEQRFYARCPPEQRPRVLSQNAVGTAAINNVTEDTNVAGGILSERGTANESDNEDSNNKRYDSSLLKALHSTFFWSWWGSGILKLVSDTLKTTTPLVNKVLLNWLTNSYVFYHASEAERSFLGLDKPQGIGYGIGLAFALFVMQGSCIALVFDWILMNFGTEVASLMTNHFTYLAMRNGIFIRTALIGSIFRKSLRLSGRARIEHSAGKITTMISSDATRLDLFAGALHNLWVAPIQIIIGIGLLIGNLGYSALVGLGVLIFGFPLQMVLVKILFAQRIEAVGLTDKRVRMTSEVLQGIRLIKFYAWEAFYAHRIGNLRANELAAIRRASLARAALICVVTFLPVVASILSFITYALSGHDLNVAIIFTSLQFFNIIREPLMFFPGVIAAAADGAVALGRIGKFLTAEELAEPYAIRKESDFAIDVNGDFEWETVQKPGSQHQKQEKPETPASEKVKPPSSSKGKEEKSPELPTSVEAAETMEAQPVEKNEEEEKPFALKDLRLQIPKGSFVAIAVFSSPVAYVPQVSWIMNATLRQNIIFGREEDENRLREMIKACCLEHDLNMLPNGEYTEIGEKGINLSGGQKARVSLARAAYSDSDIILMDDSLSAVDAYVGKQILDNCILSGPLAGKTRVLATHALFVLDKTDFIYVMENGKIAEQGTYKELKEHSVLFSQIMNEYGSPETTEKGAVEEAKVQESSGGEEVKQQKAQIGLMQDEERLTGSVSFKVYAGYFRFSGGLVWAPLILLLLTLSQAAQVANNLFLGYWTAGSIPGFSQGEYMATYAGLGAAAAVFSFALSFALSLSNLTAGFRMFRAALLAVLRSPVSFFDTTPMGRITSRLSKDQDTLDAEVPLIAYQFLSILSSVLGTAGLVFYIYPYLGIMFAPMSVLYLIAAVYYRRTSVETKRLDSLLRSAIYASYSEALTGLSTVRGYGEQGRFVHAAEEGLDMENRAYYMTVAIQRWLGVRLDLLGNLLILGIALFAAGFRDTVSPSKTGVVLSYTLSITQILSELVSTYARNEQNFNAVERILHYTKLESEGELVTPEDPPPTWPEQGGIQFKDVKLSYRPGLPLILKGVTFDIRPGEKVGVVGRTGAGKSSLLQALFRIVNIQDGTIVIDGYNTRNIGLDVLRGRLALVPQDNTLFLGTLRENLDPQGTRTDAEIISALRRVWLLPAEGTAVDPVQEAKFSLDSAVSDEGSNYSAGEKQLLALCRALVKQSRIIVLDEATSSVDVETDAKVQRTIQTEFSSSTLLCIAHRLNTIMYYDRIMVMDAGEVAEIDTPLNLYDKEDSIFRSLCNEAGLTRQDIVRIRSSVTPIT